ncbi:MAG: tetratricopeptide repeat protein [Magnetococcales bacterium]|nr:tetratricopeptide repeat protein [Magnetococcales bacterium]
MSSKKQSQKSKDTSPQITVDMAYKQAMDHFAKAQYQEVDRLCTAIIQAVPNHIDAINLLGVVAQRVNLHEQAVTQFLRAINIDKNRALLYFNLAISLNMLERKQEAITELQKALQIEPDNTQIAQYLAEIGNNSISDKLQAELFSYLQQGVEFHKAGLMDKALGLYEKVCRLQPDNHQVYGNMGAVLQSKGEYEKATTCYKKALNSNDENVDVLSNLGTVLTKTGKYKEAYEVLKKAVATAPGFAAAHFNLGNLFIEQNRLTQAIASFREAILLDPNLAVAYCNLANALKEQGELQEAIENYQKASAIIPDDPEILNNFATAIKACGRLDEAINIYKKVVALKPDYAQAHSNLGLALQAKGRLSDAKKCYDTAVKLKVDNSEAYNNLGFVLTELKQYQKAQTALIRAITINPDFAQPHYNLGNLYSKQHMLEKSVVSYKQAIALQADFAQAHSNLGKVLSDQGKLPQAMASFKQSLAIQPDMVGSYSNILMCSQYIPDQTLKALYDLHVECANIPGFGVEKQCYKHKNRVDLNRKLRIGLVSADLGLHPVGYFLHGFFSCREKSQVEIICYSDRDADAMTVKLQNMADEWHETMYLSDDELADKVHGDTIDILIDLAGHTSNNRLQMFAKKPAPIQITWAGYVGTTGLPAMDWLIADRYYVKEGEDKFYSEGVIRLADSWASYTAPDYTPDVLIDPQVDGDGTKTDFILGCFSNPIKINKKMLIVWGQVLNRIADSKLLLIYRGMDDPSNVKRIHSQMTKGGIAADRVVIEGLLPHKELLGRYNSVDIALDCLPYSGGLTTMEALWMGVPVVTTSGSTFAGRHAQSILNCVGLDELVTDNFDQYVDLVVELAKDRDRLSSLKKGLRDRVANSHLCDHNRFSKDLTAQFRKVWQQWCGEQ